MTVRICQPCVCGSRLVQSNKRDNIHVSWCLAGPNIITTANSYLSCPSLRLMFVFFGFTHSYCYIVAKTLQPPPPTRGCGRALAQDLLKTRLRYYCFSSPATHLQGIEYHCETLCTAGSTTTAELRQVSGVT